MAAEERAAPEFDAEAGIAKPELGVFARPVDTMVTPSAGTRLSQLARALSPMSHDLGDLASTLEERAKTSGKIQGEAEGAEAFQKSQGSYSAAVAAGQLDAAHNPWARFYAKEAFGHLAAEKYAQDFNADPDVQAALDGATSMDVFDKAQAEFHNKWLDKNIGHGTHADPVFQASFTALQTAHAQELRNSFAEKVNHNFIGQNVEMFGGNTTATLRNAIESGQYGKDPDSVINLIQQQAKAFRANTGLSQRAVVAATANSLVQLAQDVAGGRVGDGTMTADDVLNIAKKLPGLGTTSLYDDPTMGKLREEALSKIRAETRQKIAIDRSRDALEKEQGLHDVNSEFMKDFTDHNLKPAGYYRDKMEEWSPTSADKFQKRYDAMLGNSWNTDEGVLAHLTSRLVGTTDRDDPEFLKRDDIYDALTSHDITPQDAMKLLTKIQERDDPKKRGGGSKGVFQDPEWQNLYTGNFKSMIAGDFSPGDRKAIQSRINMELSDAWEDWAGSHPNASSKDKREFIESTFNRLYIKDVPTDVQNDIKYNVGEMIKPGSRPNFQSQRALPQDLVEETIRAMEKHKPFDPILSARLAQYGLTNPDSIVVAMLGQSRLYDIKPKPAQQSSTP